MRRPFHIIKLANAAVDEVRRAAWNSARRAAGVARPGPLARVGQDPAAQTIKHTRWALLKDPATLTEQQQATLDRLRRARHVLFRAWALKEELRDLYRLPEDRRADAHLDAWLARASRCRIPPCWTCHAPSAATATRSWPPSSWACPTANSKASTPRFG